MFSTPLLELVFHAARVHRMYNDPQMVRASLSQQAPRLQPVFPGAVNRACASHLSTQSARCSSIYLFAFVLHACARSPSDSFDSCLALRMQCRRCFCINRVATGGLGAAAGAALHAAEHKDGRVPGDVHLLRAEHVLEQGSGAEGGEADGHGGGAGGASLLPSPQLQPLLRCCCPCSTFAQVVTKIGA